MSCGQGTIQSRGTCWFHSIINGFLLSENGQKILYDKLKEFYNRLTLDEKSFFNDGIDAPCPFKTVKPLFFYKFLDQYLCFISGPRAIKTRAGLSPKLLENLNFVGNSAIVKTHKGAKGAHPVQEILQLLDKLGFENEYSVKVTSSFKSISNRITKWTRKKKPNNPKFIININNSTTTFNMFRGYVSMCCVIVIEATTVATDTNPSIHKSHAISGYVCNNKKFIIDSNYLVPIECDWSNLSNVNKILPEISKGYSHIYTKSRFDYIINARIGFVSNIYPACLLKYKKVSSDILLKRYKTIKTLNSNKNKLNPSNYLSIKRYILQKSKMGILTKIFNPNPPPKPLPKPIPSPNQGVNKLGRKIYKGVKGGLYVLDTKGKKIYKPVAVKPVKKGVNIQVHKIYTGVKGKKVVTPPLKFLNSKKRLIRVSDRGAFYVLEGAKKIYNPKAMFTNSGRLLTSVNSVPNKIKK